GTETFHQIVLKEIYFLDEMELSDLGQRLAASYGATVADLPVVEKFVSEPDPCSLHALAKLGENGGLCELGQSPTQDLALLRDLFLYRTESPGLSPRITELQPASGKACPTQTGQDWRATAHDLPQQPGAMILDHQHHRTLIDAEVIRRNPPAGRTAFYGERLIERRQESVFSHHAQIQLGKIAHSRYDNLRSERQGGDDHPGCDGAVIGTEGGAASGVVEELALNTVDDS